jgi:hypothetical protein
VARQHCRTVIDADIGSSSWARCSMAASSSRVAAVRSMAPTRRTRCAVAADHDVLQRRHVGEQADVLEGARDAGGGDACGAVPVQRRAVEDDLPRSAAYRPVSTLKKVVLPAPLGPIRP